MKPDTVRYDCRGWHATGYQPHFECLLRERTCQLHRTLQVTNTEQVLDMNQYTTGLADR